jgi:hypothetical protein
VSENNQNFGPSTMFCIHKLTELSVSFEVLDQQSAPNETFPIAQDATAIGRFATREELRTSIEKWRASAEDKGSGSH